MQLPTWSCLFLGAVLLLFAGCSAHSSDEQVRPLRIGTAANTRPAVQEIAHQFTQSHGQVVELVSGSSGKLATQIRHAAPYDVFISASPAYAEALRSDEFTRGKVHLFAKGKLHLWTRTKAATATFPQALLASHIQHIAIANPRVAPYGQAAQEALRSADVAALTENKLVMGTSVGQVNQYILSGAVDAALTSQSFTLKETDQRGQIITVPSHFYAPIYQCAIEVIQPGQPPHPKSQEFISYLGQREAQAILQQFGYDLMNEAN